MNDTTAEAQYIGDNYAYFSTGATYKVEIVQALFGRIKVAPVHGYHNKPMLDMQVTYRNLHDFLHHWQVTKVIHENLYNPGGAPMQQNRLH